MRRTKNLRLPLISVGSDDWASKYWEALETLDRLGSYIQPTADGGRVTFYVNDLQGVRIPWATVEPRGDGTLRINIGRSSDEVWIKGEQVT